MSEERHAASMLDTNLILAETLSDCTAALGGKDLIMECEVGQRGELIF